MNTRIRTVILVALAALTLAMPIAIAQAPVSSQAQSRRPRLIVLLMVDQMRGDYIDKLQQQWTGGLHRLVTQGAWFRQVDYPYFDTVTCAGHATVGTGSFPSTHGMVMNTWWDRTRNAEVACTEDPAATPVSYGHAVTGPGDSGANIRTSTLSDELRAQLNPSARVIGFSLKARAAIGMSGHRPDAVAWFDDSGTWVTSTAFSTLPVPEVADFIRRHPVENDFGKVWTRSLPQAAYLYEDPAVGAHPSAGLTATFPHRLNGVEAGPASKFPNRVFYDQWQSSPYADQYLAAMALDVATQMRLGREDAGNTTTDMMAISFSTLDKVGHDFGPNSHEIQDVLVRLDQTIGTLLTGLDRLVGPDNYTVALAADHGVSPVPERAVVLGLDGGRVPAAAITRAIEEALQSTLGPAQGQPQGHASVAKYVAHVINSDVYLESGVFERMAANPAARAAVRHALRAVPGVLDVYTRDRIEADRFDDDPIGRRLAHSFVSDRSGDLMVVLKPYWLTGAGGTSHGTPYGFDTRVPILMMGKGIVPGEYLQPATPADVAPTLAFLAGITLPRAQGRVLIEAIGSAGANGPLLNSF